MMPYIVYSEYKPGLPTGYYRLGGPQNAPYNYLSGSVSHGKRSLCQCPDLRLLLNQFYTDTQLNMKQHEADGNHWSEGPHQLLHTWFEYLWSTKMNRHLRWRDGVGQLIEK